VNDDTLTPFVDALSASLCVMVLVSISFIVQNTLQLVSAAKGHVEKSIIKSDQIPIKFNLPIAIDLSKNEITYASNFRLTETEIEYIRQDIDNFGKVKIVLMSNQSQAKSTANLIRFLLMLKLADGMPIETEIIEISSPVSLLKWADASDQTL
jgi:hypothetical protein